MALLESYKKPGDPWRAASIAEAANAQHSSATHSSVLRVSADVTNPLPSSDKLRCHLRILLNLVFQAMPAKGWRDEGLYNLQHLYNLDRAFKLHDMADVPVPSFSHYLLILCDSEHIVPHYPCLFSCHSEMFFASFPFNLYRVYASFKTLSLHLLFLGSSQMLPIALKI